MESQENGMESSAEGATAKDRNYGAYFFFFYPMYAKAVRPIKYLQAFHISSVLFISLMKTHV